MVRFGIGAYEKQSDCFRGTGILNSNNDVDALELR
jgi:hypothetical protein